MPQASTVEYLRKLRDLTREYTNRCTPIEFMGALETMKFEINAALNDCNEEEAEEEDD